MLRLFLTHSLRYFARHPALTALNIVGIALGVKAVVAQSFERIHRSNLVGMGVLPLCFAEGVNAASLKLDGTEVYSLKGLTDEIKPRQTVNLEIKRADGKVELVPVVVRIDTPIEVDYYQHGGILPYVLRQIVRKA